MEQGIVINHLRHLVEFYNDCVVEYQGSKIDMRIDKDRNKIFLRFPYRERAWALGTFLTLFYFNTLRIDEYTVEINI